jgi:hypothetical protein
VTYTNGTTYTGRDGTSRLVVEFSGSPGIVEWTTPSPVRGRVTQYRDVRCSTVAEFAAWVGEP